MYDTYDRNVLSRIISDNNKLKSGKPVLHEEFKCSVDPDIWRKAIEDIKNNKQG